MDLGVVESRGQRWNHCSEIWIWQIWFSLITPKDPEKKEMKGDERSKVEYGWVKLSKEGNTPCFHTFQLIPPRQITEHPCLFQASSCDFLWWWRLAELTCLRFCRNVPKRMIKYQRSLFMLKRCSKANNIATWVAELPCVERKIKGSSSAACWWGCWLCARSKHAQMPGWHPSNCGKTWGK